MKSHVIFCEGEVVEFQDDALAVPTFELLNAEWEERFMTKKVARFEDVGHSLNANKARGHWKFAADFQDSGASNRSSAELSLKQRGSSAAVGVWFLNQQTKGVIDFYRIVVKLMAQVEDIVQMKQQFPLKARWTWGLRTVHNTEWTLNSWGPEFTLSNKACIDLSGLVRHADAHDIQFWP